jgi:hypothetical protein
MANLGNAWHIPENPHPRGSGGMLDPVGALVPGMDVSIFSGNQFTGDGGNAGRQTGGALHFKATAEDGWTELPLRHRVDEGNDAYFSATIAAAVSRHYRVGDHVQYYLQITYDDAHDTTFVHVGANGSVTTDDESDAQASPFTFPLADPAVCGLWEPVFSLPNVAVHTHVLSDGRVLMWGRREDPDPSLDAHSCTPFVWDPADSLASEDVRTANTVNTPQPTRADGVTKVNLFCGGHTTLPDGRLLAIGGHILDGEGLDQAALYELEGAQDPERLGRWTATETMNHGRWYPTATALPDGSVLALGGGIQGDNHNLIPQVWSDGHWRNLPALAKKILDLYPRVHLLSTGKVFISGPLANTFTLETTNGQLDTAPGDRHLGQCDYAPAVMYRVDKILYIGGGNHEGGRPTNEVETIDFTQPAPAWRRAENKANAMHFARRQHNAVILPDGTVLVTGGTRGGGSFTPAFNDLGWGQPVHVAEVWNPDTDRWTELAAEEVDRCYHSTAVLLPDASVLSAGGGEYKPDNIHVNDPSDTHRNAQIFRPPYLFKGPRPEIRDAPAHPVTYGDAFVVKTTQLTDIKSVSWIRLASVTHAFDQSQRINFLGFRRDDNKLTVNTPASPNECPPGYYMLFVLNTDGVPSVAHIMRIQAAPEVPFASWLRRPRAAASNLLARMARMVRSSGTGNGESVQGVYRSEAARVAGARGTRVVVGLTPTCPYGLGACWGGAYEALSRLDRVDVVNPKASLVDSTAEVVLRDASLPPLQRWADEFSSIAGTRYRWRGVEVTLHGTLYRYEGALYLDDGGRGPAVRLAPFGAADSIGWDHRTGRTKPATEPEELAYWRLEGSISPGQRLTVTGPLQQTDAGYRLHIRLFAVDTGSKA